MDIRFIGSCYRLVVEEDKFTPTLPPSSTLTGAAILSYSIVAVFAIVIKEYLTNTMYADNRYVELTQEQLGAIQEKE